MAGRGHRSFTLLLVAWHLLSLTVSEWFHQHGNVTSWQSRPQSGRARQADSHHLCGDGLEGASMLRAWNRPAPTDCSGCVDPHGCAVCKYLVQRFVPPCNIDLVACCVLSQELTFPPGPEIWSLPIVCCRARSPPLVS